MAQNTALPVIAATIEISLGESLSVDLNKNTGTLFCSFYQFPPTFSIISSFPYYTFVRSVVRTTASAVVFRMNMIFLFSISICISGYIQRAL